MGFDFGGGTFDVTVTTVTYSTDGSPNIVEKSIGGIGNLGGGKIDHQFLEYLLGKIQAQEGTKFDDDKDFQSKLLENVVSAKCELSVSDGVGIFMELPNNN